MKIFFCEKARAATWILPLFLIIIILVISSFDTLKQSTRAVYQKKKGEPFFNSSIINPPTEHPDVWLPVSIKMSCLFSPFSLARGDKNVS